jgi:precorrin-6B methylase 2
MVILNAKVLSCQRMLYTALILVNTLLDVDIPNNVSNQAWADPIAGSLARQAADAITNVNPIRRDPSQKFQVRSIQTLRGKIDFTLNNFKKSFRVKRMKAAKGMKNSHGPRVSFEPTLSEVVDQMLTLAEVGPDDLVYDLGCGDGRIVVAAARDYGARAVGIDIDPQRIAESKALASAAGVEHLVSFVQQDAAIIDLSPATVVTLYMGSSWLKMIGTRLRQQLSPGSRIVSHKSDFPSWPPIRMKFVISNRNEMRPLFLWRIE